MSSAIIWMQISIPVWACLSCISISKVAICMITTICYSSDGEDFISTVQMLTFNATTRKLCVEVQIVNDGILESGAESFSIILTSTDPAVNLSLSNTTVKITDNDRK